MNDQKKNLLIGIFVLAAIAIGVYFVLYLNPKAGDEGQTLHVKFSNIDKVAVGTRVLFGGHHVGEVSHIQEVDNAREPAYIRDGIVYIYELTLKIDSKIEVYTTDMISIRTSGLLGERSIEITPLPAKKGKPLIRVKNQILYAQPVSSVEDAVVEVASLAQTAQAVIQKVDEGLEILQDNLFFESLASIAANVNEISTELNQIGSWKGFAEDITGMAKNFRQISDTIQEGQGTLGQLIQGDDLYMRFTSLLSKGETIMDDITHYGLLFNNNKNWQRLRARRMNLMAKLETPQEFHNFFNDEINQISTALSRVNIVLTESQTPTCIPIVCRPEFKKVFTELLRRIEGLEQNIKLYDQQLIETIENNCSIMEPCH